MVYTSKMLQSEAECGTIRSEPIDRPTRVLGCLALCSLKRMTIGDGRLTPARSMGLVLIAAYLCRARHWLPFFPSSSTRIQFAARILCVGWSPPPVAITAGCLLSVP